MAQPKRPQADPLYWEKFKAFLRKNLGKSDMFVAHVWAKMWEEFQYHHEDTQDWAAYLENFQSILSDFDTDCAVSESQHCRTFYNGLRPSLKL